MQIGVQTGELKDSSAKAIIVTVFEGANASMGAVAEVDRALDGAISRLVEEGDVTGRSKETTLVHTLGRIPSPRVLVLGLGKSDAFDGQVLRNTLAVAARYLRRTGAESVAIGADSSLGLATDACA
jgi:leucyl aminopeptidase